MTAFLLPLAVAAAVWLFFFPKPPAAGTNPAPAPAASPRVDPLPVGTTPQPASGAAAQDGVEPVFERTFGAVGERGAVHIVFDRRAASVRSIRLLDEPATPEARRAGTWTVAQSYELVQPFPALRSGTHELGWLTSLALERAESGSPTLRASLGAPWESRDLPERDGVEFTLRDAATDLSLRRTYRHVPRSRELVLTVALAAEPKRRDEAKAALSDDGRVPLWLHGVSIENPSIDHVLGNPAIGIGRMVDTRTMEARILVERPGEAGKNERIGYSQGTELIDFAGTTNRFFGGFLRPTNDAANRALTLVEMAKLPAVDAMEHHRPFSVPVASYRLMVDVPEDGAQTELEFRLYLGPKSAGVFNEDPAYERYDAVMDVDLNPMCPCTIPGAALMAKLLLWGLRHLHDLVGSWGLAIILLTFIVRGSLVPLNFRMQKTMRAFGARAARLQPELEAIKQRHAKEPKKMQQEMLAFQRKHKLFPPLGGCLPLLVTIPVFLGLFTALRVAYELRCQPFIGWIDDLSQPDRLFALGFSFLPYFNLLPVLMVALWLVLQAGTPLPKDPQQRQVMKIMRFMPLLFGVMLYNYAAGLMVYMVTSSLFGIAEQKLTKKILGPPPEMGVGAMPTF